jgi:hypothetical protein
MKTALKTPSARFPVVLLMAALLVPGCDSAEEQNQFALDAGRAASGFTRVRQVDNDYEIVDEDEDDWRIAPVFRGQIDVEPARPNPVGVGLAFIPLRIVSPGVVQRLALRVQNVEQGRTEPVTEIVDASTVGAYELTFSQAQLPGKGLHRMFVFDEFGEIVTYGDVMVE